MDLGEILSELSLDDLRDYITIVKILVNKKRRNKTRNNRKNEKKMISNSRHKKSLLNGSDLDIENWE
jgi:hypothetical protein